MSWLTKATTKQYTSTHHNSSTHVIHNIYHFKRGQIVSPRVLLSIQSHPQNHDTHTASPCVLEWVWYAAAIIEERSVNSNLFLPGQQLTNISRSLFDTYLLIQELRSLSRMQGLAVCTGTAGKTTMVVKLQWDFISHLISHQKLSTVHNVGPVNFYQKT